jgi:hypothetical protein
MGKERVVLKHGVDVPLVGREVGHIAARQLYPSLIGTLEAGNHPEAGGLSRAGGPEEREELVLSYVQVDAVDRDELAVCLASPVEAHGDVPIPGHPGVLYRMERLWCE